VPNQPVIWVLLQQVDCEEITAAFRHIHKQKGQYSAVTLGSGTLTEMAKYFHRDVATLSRGVRRISAQLKAGKASEHLLTVLEKLQLNYCTESSPICLDPPR
jgi:hypothetical protein